MGSPSQSIETRAAIAGPILVDLEKFLLTPTEMAIMRN